MQRKGTKRRYDEGDGIFGAIIDCLKTELMRKGLNDKADEFYKMSFQLATNNRTL